MTDTPPPRTRGIRSTPNRWMLAATSTSFLIFTMRWGFLLTAFVSQVIEDLMNQHHDEEPDLSTTKISRLRAILYPTLPIISDGIVVWRCWVLFAERRRLMLLPLALLLGTIATSSVAMTLAWKRHRHHARHRHYAHSAAYFVPVLALLTNVVATSLIFYRLWDHRRTIRSFTHLNNVSRAQRVMVLLLESGVIYCVLQLGTLIAWQFTVPLPQFGKDYELRILSEVSLSLTAMYPSIVVVLVDRQRSMVDTFELSVEFRNLALEDRDSSAR